MSGNISKEAIVCNALWEYFKEKKSIILQLVYPGAQATLSIRFTDRATKKSRTVFPDLIALDSDLILVGEVKATFSISDKTKLLQLKNSIDGEGNIKNLVTRNQKRDFTNSQIRYLIVHSDLKSSPDPEIYQLVHAGNTFSLI